MTAHDLPSRVRAARIKRKWTQQDLSDRTGVSVRSLTAYENRRQSLQPARLRVVCEVLEIDMRGESPEDADDAIAQATRDSWDPDIALTLDVIGQVLSTLEDEERQAVMSGLIRWLMDRKRGNQSA
jgi:transcriptional regulator with XRE-family HTH domain